MSRYKRRFLLRSLLALLIAVVAPCRSTAQLGSPVPIPDDPTAPIPDLNTRTSDGFLVKCYWIGSYYSVSKTMGDDEPIDILDAALRRGWVKQETNLSVFITEEVDSSGNLRAVGRGGKWSSTVTGERTSGSGGGPIPTSGSGAPTATVRAGDTIGISLSWPDPDALAFNVTYRPLKITMKKIPSARGLSGTQSWVECCGPSRAEKWSADILGMVFTEEPITPGRTTVRQEWGSPGSGWYARWSMTRVCEYARVKLITPHGNPRTKPRDSGDGQNEFTYDTSQPGRLVINFKAKLIPSIPGLALKMAPRVRFRIDEIGKTLPEWDRPNPDGQASVAGNSLVAKLTVIGLPIRNSDFGKKRVDLLLDGQVVESTDVEVFFTKDIRNHPGTIDAPNWFYYWQEGGVCGIAPRTSYDPRADYGWSANATQTVYLGPLAAGANEGPERYMSGSSYGSLTVTGRGKGIKCVAETVEHENHHFAFHNSFSAGIAAAPSSDPDTDHIPNANEPALDGIRSNPADPDTFRMGGDYSSYGDDEIRCRKKELELTVPYFRERDWANPGCQSKNRYGPN